MGYPIFTRNFLYNVLYDTGLLTTVDEISTHVHVGGC